jgi:hypothetical protein
MSRTTMTTINETIQKVPSGIFWAKIEKRPVEAGMATSKWGNFRAPNRPPAVRGCQARRGERRGLRQGEFLTSAARR